MIRIVFCIVFSEFIFIQSSLQNFSCTVNLCRRQYTSFQLLAVLRFLRIFMFKRNKLVQKLNLGVHHHWLGKETINNIRDYRNICRNIKSIYLWNCKAILHLWALKFSSVMERLLSLQIFNNVQIDNLKYFFIVFSAFHSCHADLLCKTSLVPCFHSKLCRRQYTWCQLLAVLNFLPILYWTFETVLDWLAKKQSQISASKIQPCGFSHNTLGTTFNL